MPTKRSRPSYVKGRVRKLVVIRVGVCKISTDLTMYGEHSTSRTLQSSASRRGNWYGCQLGNLHHARNSRRINWKEVLYELYVRNLIKTAGKNLTCTIRVYKEVPRTNHSSTSNCRLAIFQSSISSILPWAHRGDRHKACLKEVNTPYFRWQLECFSKIVISVLIFYDECMKHRLNLQKHQRCGIWYVRKRVEQWDREWVQE